MVHRWPRAAQGSHGSYCPPSQKERASCPGVGDNRSLWPRGWNILGTRCYLELQQSQHHPNHMIPKGNNIRSLKFSKREVGMSLWKEGEIGDSQQTAFLGLVSSPTPFLVPSCSKVSCLTGFALADTPCARIPPPPDLCVADFLRFRSLL